MLRRIDSSELTEWFIYSNLNPFGPERADLRAGTIASTVANCLSDSGRWKPSDFMPRFGARQIIEPESPETLKAAMIRFTSMMGGRTK